MEDMDTISFADTKDPAGCAQGPEHYQEKSRDPERTPMQWDDSLFAGFTKGTSTWLPVNENYKFLNVKAQKEALQSPLKVYSELARLRKKNTFVTGELAFQLADKNILAFVRHLRNEPSFLIVINTSEVDQTVDATSGLGFSVPARGTILIRSSTDQRNETAPGGELDLTSISLIPGEGMVVQLNN